MPHPVIVHYVRVHAVAPPAGCAAMLIANVRRVRGVLSCGPGAPGSPWSPAVVVDPGSSSYSAVAVRHPAGPGVPKLYDLWAWSNTSQSPNDCIFGDGGLCVFCAHEAAGWLEFAAHRIV
eukprot:COSAG01_NODE_5203_length_4414_cov_3.702897_3_plen_120_part_00